jgi:hypothetical protein
MKTGSKLAIFLLALVAVAHLLRLIYGISITVGEWVVPQWVSALGIIAPGVIAGLLWQESK